MNHLCVYSARHGQHCSITSRSAAMWPQDHDNVTEMAKKIAEELMATQVKFFYDEIKKMQDKMSKMKEELSKKVDDAISGKNDATSGNNEANKDVASDVGAGEHTHEKGIYSNMNSMGRRLPMKRSPPPKWCSASRRQWSLRGTTSALFLILYIWCRGIPQCSRNQGTLTS